MPLSDHATGREASWRVRGAQPNHDSVSKRWHRYEMFYAGFRCDMRTTCQQETRSSSKSDCGVQTSKMLVEVYVSDSWHYVSNLGSEACDLLELR